LKDDSFNSIAEGVREGRKIWDNLVKGISYYLSVKIALVLSFIVPLAMGISFPFAPIQIIVLELFMDLAASATFVAEPIEPDAMKRVHKRGEKFLGRTELLNISLASLSLAAAILINYLRAVFGGVSIEVAQTIAFATWLIGHLFLALVMRSHREVIVKIGLFSNRIMIAWGAAVIVFLLLATNVPAIQGALKLTYLGPEDWLWAVAVPFVTIFWLEIKKAIQIAVSKT
jgi:P-type Ca2+ transporter type 2C